VKTATDNRQGHVYLIHAIGTSRYKIGMASKGRMARRFDELNSSQAAFPLKVVRVIDVDDRFDVEGNLHERFKQNRVYGEWFNFPRGTGEVEKVMRSYGAVDDTRQPLEKWRLITLIAGVIILMFAWQSYQGDRSQVIPQFPIPSVPNP